MSFCVGRKLREIFVKQQFESWKESARPQVRGQLLERTCARVWQRALTAVLVALAVLWPGQQSWAVSSTLVVSQVQVAGTNAADEFVELHNISAAPINVNGFKVVYRAATGTSDVSLATLGNVSIPAGGYFLVGAAPGYDGGVPADATYADGGSGRLAAAGGGLAVRDAADVVVDSVAYGTATNAFREGTTTPAAPAANNSISRKNAGRQDTDNNSADFETLTPSAPRNSSTPPDSGGVDTAPTITARTPANGATSVAVNSNISITFSEAVTAGAGAFSVSGSTSGVISVAVSPASGSASTFTLDPQTDFAPGETITVTVQANAIADVDGTPDNLAANDTFTFTAGTPGTPGADRIRDIQGAAQRSPKLGATVTNVPGIVTARRSNGFYFQDATPDTNDATSEGIFVFTSTAPTAAVGDSVLVSGTVSEFRGDATGLSTTQIGSPTVSVLSSNNTLPAPTVIGQGGRVPPTQVIEDDANGNVEASNTFDPASDGLDFYESLEGMRVQVNNAVATGPTSSFNEISVLADGGAGATGRTPRGGILVTATDFNPERIIIDDAIIGGAGVPDVNTGDGVGTIVGVMDYGFGNFKLLVTAPVTRTAVPLPRTIVQTTEARELSIGTFNVENLDALEGQAKFDALAQQIVVNLKSPDILTLEEVQDNDGPTNSSVVDPSETLNKLIAAISSAGGPAYQFRQVSPVDDTNGGQPGGNIRVVFLFNPARGVSFVDRAGGTATTPNAVQTVSGQPQLQFNPGLIDPTNAAFNNSRKPLAGEFLFRGQKFFVIGNHFNSKGGDQPLFGVNQPPVRSSEVQRKQQATIVRNFVNQIKAANANARVVVLGDINDFEFSEVVDILEGATGGMTSLFETLPANERYSYVFDGNSQVLDQIIVSNNLLGANTEFEVAHINAEYFDQLSDHDPQVARFFVNTAPTAPANQVVAVPRNTATPFTLAAVDAEGDTLTITRLSEPANGTLSGTGTNLTFTPAPNFTGTSSFTYRAGDGSTDSAIFTVTFNVTGQNIAPVNTLPQSASTSEDTALTLRDAARISIADADAGTGALRVSLTATNGTLSLSRTTGLTFLSGDGTTDATLSFEGTLANLNAALDALVFTPAADFNGTATLTIQTNDRGNSGQGGEKTDSDTLSITVSPVNDAPVANGDDFTTPAGTALTIAAPGVLSNDTDIDSASTALTATLASPATSGTVVLNPNGGFTFTPASGFSGVATFTYTASDGALSSAPTTVRIGVGAALPVNKAPVADGQNLLVDEDFRRRIVLEGSDEEGDELSFRIVAPPRNGTLSGTAPNLTYTPNANFNGPDSFTFVVRDGQVESAPATVTLQVLAVNDAPVLAPDTYRTGGRALSIAAPGVLANDVDADGDTLRITLVQGPTKGTLRLNNDGSFTYTPFASQGGQDGFTYRVQDAGAALATARVTLFVGAARDNTAPSIVLASPQPNAVSRTLPPVIGYAVDGLGDAEIGAVRPSGLRRVEVSITRLSDGFTFNGVTFVRGAHVVNAAIAARTFRVANSPRNVPDGLYRVVATAFDNVDNRRSVTAIARVDRTPPQAILDSPRDGQVLARFGTVRGRVLDNGGSGVVRARLFLTRFDGLFWNGQAFTRTPFAFTVAEKSGSFTLNAPLPTGASLPPGAYQFTLDAFDAAGNSSRSITRVRIASSPAS
jgi:predicted extracellular nuclease